MEQEYITKIIEIKAVTHDVKGFRLEKPAGYHFTPGQATDVCINKEGFKNERRPFTFTSVNEDSYLEFTIKRYPDHHGVTDELHRLNPGDELILHDVWGAIHYKEPGYFIAGGAGITPFMAILRQLYRDEKMKDNQLYFSNKTGADIIYEHELRGMLGNNAHFTLTREKKEGFLNERINEAFLKRHITDFNRNFYICGPDAMVSELGKILKGLGAQPEAVVFEN